jgi:hypothetical protein
MQIIGCASIASSSAKPGDNLPALQAMGFTKMVDLAHVIDPNIPIWPGDPKPTLDTIASIDKEGYYQRKGAQRFDGLGVHGLARKVGNSETVLEQ